MNEEIEPIIPCPCPQLIHDMVKEDLEWLNQRSGINPELLGEAEISDK